MSVSNDLKVDAERDLSDIGAGRIEVHALNKVPYSIYSQKTKNVIVIFVTLFLLKYTDKNERFWPASFLICVCMTEWFSSPL